MKKITLFVLLAALFLLKSNTSYSQTPIPTYTISQVKQVDTLGVADSLNVYCKLYGTINSINYTTTGLQFYMLDQNNGIFVYKSTAVTGYTFTEGDSIAVIGKIIQNTGTGFNLNYGMIAISPDSIVLLTQDNALQAPIVITQLKNDSLESRLVMIDSLRYVSGWTGNNTRTVLTLHGTDTITIRIPTTCNLHNVVAPTNTVFFSITGCVNQASLSTTPPYIGGYRIYPRDSFDYVLHYTNPAVYTEGVTGITQNFAICKGYISSDGGHAITTRGICYDTLASPDTTYHVTVAGNTGNYTANISGLTAGTTYHYRAYAVNSLGLFYGSDSVFTTSPIPVLPIVTTNTATNITIEGAVVVGNVINNGGDTIISEGICWSTSNLPTITDSVFYFGGTTTPFSDTIRNQYQATTFYARAFATSDIGTGYGNVISFTTAKLPPLYPILPMKSVNASGVADSLTVSCRLVGIVHSINHSATTAGINFYICDTNSGINVTRTSNLGYTVNRGDMVRVIGRIQQIGGLIELAPDSIVLISTGNTLNNPIVLSTLSEPYESRLVRMDNLTYISGWPTTAGNTTSTVKTYNGTDTITIMITRFSNLKGTAAPIDTFSVIGIESQVDATVPYTSGYNIYPRDVNDIIITGTLGINENKSKPSFSVYPNPGNGNFTVVLSKNVDAEVSVFSMIGNLITEKVINTTFTNLDISSYGKGMYMIQIRDLKTGLKTTEKLIVQ